MDEPAEIAFSHYSGDYVYLKVHRRHWPVDGVFCRAVPGKLMERLRGLVAIYDGIADGSIVGPVSTLDSHVEVLRDLLAALSPTQEPKGE